MTTDHRGAWSDFWADNRQAGHGGGCLPQAWQGIDAAQKAAWKGFAAKLPKGARVLDLATGDGRVMAWLLAARKDLKPVGVDLSAQLPEPPRGAKVRSGVAMEELPFPGNRFRAVVSQFGFEYGDLARSARELARVLAPDGSAGLMTHRQDGPILAHNLERRAQIRWAIEEKNLPEIAIRSLELRAVGVSDIPAAILSAPQEGAARFGPRSAAWEIPEAIRQCLVMGRGDNPANVTRLIRTIAAKASNELARIASLEAACAQTADEEGLVQALRSAGLIQVSAEPVSEAAGHPPFADFRLIRPA